MDARLDPARALGLEEGDAHVIRNATTPTADGDLASVTSPSVKPFALEAFPDADADVLQSIARIRASPFVPRKDAVRGFVYEVETGRLREVT